MLLGNDCDCTHAECKRLTKKPNSKRNAIKTTGLLLIFAFFLYGTADAQLARPPIQKPYNGPNEVNELPPMGVSTTGPQLKVNGNPVNPMADDQEDLILSLCTGTKTWKLLKEFTPWDDVNRFGFYTDLGTGNVKTLVFSGPNSEGFTTTTAAAGNVGLWLLNDVDGNLVYSSGDSYLFSERSLTVGATAGEHQWFMVYDVSAYKGTGATYFFESPTEDFTTTGDYDYLFYIDDNHTSSNFDHNDMILGVTCPSTDCDSVKISNHYTVEFQGVSYDSVGGTSTWCYTVLWDGVPPGLSHFTIELCSLLTNANLVSANPSYGSIGPDGSTGLYGIKWDNISNFPANTEVSFCFTLDQMLEVDNTQFAPKAGVNSNIATICGPSLDCEISDPCANKLNSAPTATCPGNSSLFVCSLSPICISGFTATDPNNNIATKTVNIGTLSGNQVCFTPVAGNNLIRFIVTDSCGLADTCETTVNVTLNAPPVATCPGNSNMFVCSLSPICLSGFTASDPNNNIATKTVNVGTLSGNQVCFTPVAGNNLIRFIVTDSCGLADTCETTINVILNAPPVATCPGNSNMFVCSLSPICISGFTASDPNNNIATKTVNVGTLSGNQVCFTPVAGNNLIRFIVTDSCGKADTCETTVNVTLNAPPVATCPGNSSIFVCDLSPICISGFTATDPNNNIASKTVNIGTLSGNQVCFTPVAGNNLIRFIVTDSCGKADTCETTVNVTLNAPPVATCPGNSSLFVCDLSQICISGFTATDPNNNIATKTVNVGTLSGNQVCFTPVAGNNLIRFIVTDSCGKADTCETTVTVTLNAPPVATCPGNSSIFVCDLSEICVPGFTATDPNNNIASFSVNNGVLAGDSVCFVPVVGDNLIRFVVTDSCGRADTCETTINVTLNAPPVATCPGNSTLFVCNLNQICVSGFTGTDPNNNIASKTVNNGTLTNGTVCFTPVVGNNLIRFIVTDSCGAADTCETTVTVALNSPPVATCPGNSTVFVCDLSQICVSGFSVTDPNNNIASETVNLGLLSNGSVCFTPAFGNNLIRYIVTDSCGAADTCETTVTVVLNAPPVATCPGNLDTTVCDLSQICVSGFTATDPDNNIASISVDSGSLNGDVVCFTPTEGANLIIFTVTDSCGATDVCSTTVIVTLSSPPQAMCPSGSTSLTVVCGTEICIPGFSCTGGTCSVNSPFTLNGNSVCFTPDTSGLYTIILYSNEGPPCNRIDSCIYYVTVGCNVPPTCILPPQDTTIIQCLPAQVCLPVSAIDSNNNFLECNKVSGPGTLVGTNWCYTPSTLPEDVSVTIMCIDSLGASCTGTFNVHFRGDLIPPTCNIPNDTTIALCAPTQICLPVSATDDCDTSPTCTKLSGPGTLTNGQWCFSATPGNQTIVATFRCVDDAGNACVDSVTITLRTNTKPDLTVGAFGPVKFCNAGSTVCVPFDVYDPDNHLSYQTIFGSVNTGDSTVCFVADTTGLYCNRLIVTDSCGLADTSNFCVQVNVCPLPNLGADTTKNFGSVCLPQSGNFKLRAASGCGPFTYKVNNVSASQDTTINYSAGYCTNFNQTWTISVTDSCGRSDSYTVTIQASVNCPPVANCPSFIPDRPICSLNTLVCISGDGFTCSDANGGATTTLNGQPYNPGDLICFTPNAFGPYTLTLICTDGCVTDTCVSVVNIVPGDCPTGCGNVVIEKTHNTIQGQFESVDVTIDSMATPIGGFDLLIEYDASALSLSQVQPGSFISGCGWEYFTYRLGGCNNCAPNACPTGAVRLIAIAEINNGPNHPDCFQMEPAQLATMIFLVTNDRTFECQYVPIRFMWCDCGDNTFSSVNGDSLYLAEHVYDYYDGISWTEITSLSSPFPTNLGPNASCDVLIGDDKPDPTRCIDFYNGGIDIVCADSIDDRGDINLNGVSNEVADAVLFGNYFVYGMGVFTVNVQGQIAATDVNADGTVLSVADLVYIIRVVIGDANPYSKLAPVNVKFNISDDGRLSVDHKTNIGAAFVMVQGQFEPILLADQMEIKYTFDGNYTRILVWSLEGRSFTGEFLQVNGPIASIEMATAEGSPVALNTVPTEFTLHQNYPNPFNPKTNISFNLPRASDYTLTIFNVKGQEVARFSGVAESAGSFEIEWEAGNYASGIYFYRLTAGSFTDMKKMILLK